MFALKNLFFPYKKWWKIIMLDMMTSSHPVDICSLSSFCPFVSHLSLPCLSSSVTSLQGGADRSGQPLPWLSTPVLYHTIRTTWPHSIRSPDNLPASICLPHNIQTYTHIYSNIQSNQVAMTWPHPSEVIKIQSHFWKQHEHSLESH